MNLQVFQSSRIGRKTNWTFEKISSTPLKSPINLLPSTSLHEEREEKRDGVNGPENLLNRILCACSIVKRLIFRVFSSLFAAS